MDPESLSNNINKLYSNATFMDKYGTDVWFSLVIFAIFFIITMYFSVINNLEVLQPQWEHIKCNPKYLPFAGLINKPIDGNYFNATSDTFNECAYKSLGYLTEMMFKPFYFMINSITLIFESTVISANELRELLNQVRKAFSKVINEVFGGIFSFILGINGIFIKIKDALNKINGVLATALYTFIGSYYTMQSLFQFIIDSLVQILYYIAASIIVMLIIFYLPFGLGSWIGIILYPTTKVMIIVTAMVVAILLVLEKVLDVHPSTGLPNVPMCFIGDTPIELYQKTNNNENIIKKISEINVGDRLKNGAVVTSMLKCSAHEQHMYKLHNVFVTGEHRVFHPTPKWIKVKNHPDSIYLPDFKPDVVYCLNTTHKEFIINETIFSDWDDIDDEVIAALNKNCVEKGYLSKGFTYEEIHTKLDSGFTWDTFVRLKNGENVEITNIKLNDVLFNNENDKKCVVLGIIKIAAHDMKLYQFNFNNKLICGSKNIHVNDPELGLINAMTLPEGEDVILIGKEQYIYHLLTSTGTFYANNIKLNDYNFGIDTYLE